MLQKFRLSVAKAQFYSPDGGRNPIRRRTESDQAANAIRSGGVRNPIRRRSVYNDKNITKPTA